MACQDYVTHLGLSLSCICRCGEKREFSEEKKKLEDRLASRTWLESFNRGATRP